MKRDGGYSAYRKPYVPKREALNIGGDGPFFKNGQLNRDSHAAPSGPEVVRGEAKHVHVYHHRDRD